MKFSKTFGTFFTSDNPVQPVDLIDVAANDRTAALNRAPGETLDVIDGRLVVIPTPVLTGAQVLSMAKKEKSASIKDACGKAIISGIECNVLGADYVYPTAFTDQANLSGLIMETLLPGSVDDYRFWCADSTGVWARRVHTKTQIQTVGLSVSNHVKAQQSKYEQKLAEIAAATQASIDSISWN